MTIDLRQWRQPVACIAVALWGVSLLTPALSMEFDPDNGQIVLEGYKVLSMGYLALLWGQFGWLANFAFFGVLIGLASPSVSKRFTRWSAIALALLALDTLDLKIRFEFHGRPHFLPGYYLWMAVNLLVAVFAVVATSSKRAITT